MTESEFIEERNRIILKSNELTDKMYEKFNAARGGLVGLDGPKPPGYTNLMEEYRERMYQLHVQYFLSLDDWHGFREQQEYFTSLNYNDENLRKHLLAIADTAKGEDFSHACAFCYRYGLIIEAF